MIESPHNDHFQQLLSLTTAKGLKEHGLFLLAGEKLIWEFLRQPQPAIVYEVMAPGQTPVAAAAAPLHISAPLFARLDVLGTHFNLLVLRQPAVPILSEAEIAAYRPSGVELVIAAGDPGNLGALIRSCEAFAVPRVILTREAAHPFLPKTVKASAGSVLRVRLARGPELRAFPASCIALDMDGTPIDDFVWPSHALLLSGEEGPGFSASRFPTRIRIPTAGVESLNIVVAASIALSRIPQPHLAGTP